jgi:hypothetical protein
MIGRWTELAVVSSTAAIARFLRKNTSLLHLTKVVIHSTEVCRSMFRKITSVDTINEKYR